MGAFGWVPLETGLRKWTIESLFLAGLAGLTLSKLLKKFILFDLRWVYFVDFLVL